MTKSNISNDIHKKCVGHEILRKKKIKLQNQVLSDLRKRHETSVSSFSQDLSLAYPATKSFLQSRQVKRTPQDSINEVIIHFEN